MAGFLEFPFCFENGTQYTCLPGSQRVWKIPVRYYELAIAKLQSEDESAIKASNSLGAPTMPIRRASIASAFRQVFAGLGVVVFALFVTTGAHLMAAQESKLKAEAAKTGDASSVERGKYIVVGVAHCGDCHTPRDANGEPDISRWLAGGPVPYLPSWSAPNWPLLEPRIAGTPPASDAAMITLFMTGIWTDGKPLRWPMPRFHMSRSDAEAVLAYLKSLGPVR